MRTWQAAIVVAALAAWATWPLVTVLGTSVTDLGDPLLNAWALAWNAHAMATAPVHIVDANIFHPERATLAYSELLWLPSLLAAPLFWLGADPMLVHNLFVFAGYGLSGLFAFVLVRRLTGHAGAALVSGVAFALAPYRMEIFPKVQLSFTWWWPLALIAVHSMMSTGSRRSVLGCGTALAAGCYSSVYLGVFGGVVIVFVAFLLALGSSRPWPNVSRLVVAVLVAGALVAPLLVPYRAASAVVGERSVGEVRHWSAKPADYLRAHPENRLHGDPRRHGDAERRLFPGIVAPLLASAAVVSPAPGPAWAYLGGTILSVALSLGVNAPGYEWLFEHVAVLRALRVPARFGLVAGLTMAILAGFGMARVVKGRSRRVQVVLTSIVVAAVAAEGSMRPQEFSTLPDPAPAVYRWLAGQPDGVVCEYPVGPLEGRVGPQDPTYMYYSTRHWKPLVNGYSGFAPPSYAALLDGLRDFPSDEAITTLRARNVTYLIVHQPFYISGDYAADVAALRARDDLRWVGRFPWRGGQSSDVFTVSR